MGHVNMVTIQLITAVCFIALVKGSTNNDRSSPRLDRNVVGGYDIDITDVPYQVSLQSEGHRILLETPHYCGGAIISDKWVLTSYICLDASPDNITVKTGSSFADDGNATGTLTKVSRFIAKSILDPDPNLMMPTEQHYNWGVVLLELASRLKFDSTTQPVKLPAQDQVFPENTLCLVSGWDELSYSLGEGLNKTLRASVLRTFQSPDYKVLAGIPKDSSIKRLALGDHGAPLVANGTLIGFTGFSFWAAEPGNPAQYCGTASVRSWIKENTGI